MNTENKTKKMEELQKAVLNKYKDSKASFGYDTVSLRTRTRNYDGNEVIYAKEIVATKGNKEFIPFGIGYTDNMEVGEIYQKISDDVTSLQIQDLLSLDQFKDFVNTRMTKLEQQYANKKSKPVRTAEPQKRETKKTQISPTALRRTKETVHS